MRTGEGERGVGQPAGQRLRAARLAATSGEVVRVEPDAVAAGHAMSGGPCVRSGALHRALHAALQLDGLQSGPEQPGRGSLEDAFEEPFEIGERSHGSGNRTRGSRKRPAAGPTSLARRYLGASRS